MPPAIPPSTDTAGQSPTLPDIDLDLYKLSLGEVVVRFTAAGLPRSNRTLQRYCEDGRLECLKADTPVGKKYFVRESSISRAIEELKQLEALTAYVVHRPTQPSTPSASEPRLEQSPQVDTAGQTPTPSDNVGHSQSQNGRPLIDPAGQEHDLTRTEGQDARYIRRLERDIDRLEKEIDVKNGQIASQHELIASMAERDKETNFLIQGYNRYILPLLGKGPPRTDQTQGA